MDNKKVKIPEIQPMHQTHRNKMTFYDSQHFIKKKNLKMKNS